MPGLHSRTRRRKFSPLYGDGLPPSNEPRRARPVLACEEAFLTHGADDMRVGLGTDIHRLEAGRPLMLGGVEIPFDQGLRGHSDGDVLLHAVTDALLGACGLPDIGELFPDTDPQYAGADSRELLRQAVRRAATAGYRPSNIDCVVHAEAPKLSAHKLVIAESIADLVELPAERVSVKAKTHEGLGPVGEGRAIAASVVAAVIPAT